MQIISLTKKQSKLTSPRWGGPRDFYKRSCPSQFAPVHRSPLSASPFLLSAPRPARSSSRSAGSWLCCPRRVCLKPAHRNRGQTGVLSGWATIFHRRNSPPRGGPAKGSGKGSTELLNGMSIGEFNSIFRLRHAN